MFDELQGIRGIDNIMISASMDKENKTDVSLIATATENKQSPETLITDGIKNEVG